MPATGPVLDWLLEGDPAIRWQAMTRFSFPTHWHYDVLRGLDYLQAAGARHDPACRTRSTFS